MPQKTTTVLIYFHDELLDHILLASDTFWTCRLSTVLYLIPERDILLFYDWCKLLLLY
jgi:hypothetical protein